MDPNFSNISFNYDDENILLNLNPDPFDFDQNPNFSPSDEINSSNTLLKYVTEILMEESIGDKQSMFYDSLALRKTEEMLQKVITDSQSQSFSPNSMITADPNLGIERIGKHETNQSRIKRNHEREILDFEESQIRKQPATNLEDGKITDLFDKVLLLDNDCDPQTLLCDEAQEVVKGEKKKKKKKKKKIQIVDFRTLLTLCAQAMSSGDEATARVLLLQIKQQSSPLGDSGQRLAHCLANALEARLHGTSGQWSVPTVIDRGVK